MRRLIILLRMLGCKKCKMGDRKSCKWFERGSLSEAVAAISIVVIILIIAAVLINAYCCHRHRHT